MALPAADLFSIVVTSIFSTYPSCFDLLRVYDACTRLGIPSQADPQTFSDRPVDPLPATVYAPFSEVMKDRFPRWEVVRQQAPGTTAPQDVEDGVKNLTRAMDPWAAGG